MYELDWWRGVMIIFATVGQTLFVLLYMTWPWYRTFLGRALFIKAVTFMLLLNVATAGRIWDWSHEDLTHIIFYGLTAVGIWAQFIAFSIYRFGHKDHESTAEKRDYHHGT